MKIVKRIPLEAYAYEELHFDSLEEYEAEYPKYVETFKKVRNKINPPPFPDDNITLSEEEANQVKY